MGGLSGSVPQSARVALAAGAGAEVGGRLVKGEELAKGEAG